MLSQIPSENLTQTETGSKSPPDSVYQAVFKVKELPYLWWKIPKTIDKVYISHPFVQDEKNRRYREARDALTAGQAVIQSLEKQKSDLEQALAIQTNIAATNDSLYQGKNRELNICDTENIDLKLNNEKLGKKVKTFPAKLAGAFLVGCLATTTIFVVAKK